MKSAGLHHTPVRFGTYLYHSMGSLRYAQASMNGIIARSLFRGSNSTGG